MDTQTNQMSTSKPPSPDKAVAAVMPSSSLATIRSGYAMQGPCAISRLNCAPATQQGGPHSQSALCHSLPSAAARHSAQGKHSSCQKGHNRERKGSGPQTVEGPCGDDSHPPNEGGECHVQLHGHESTRGHSRDRDGGCIHIVALCAMTQQQGRGEGCTHTHTHTRRHSANDLTQTQRHTCGCDSQINTQQNHRQGTDVDNKDTDTDTDTNTLTLEKASQEQKGSFLPQVAHVCICFWCMYVCMYV